MPMLSSTHVAYACEKKLEAFVNFNLNKTFPQNKLNTNLITVSVRICIADVAASPIANANRVDESAHLRVLRALLLHL